MRIKKYILVLLPLLVSLTVSMNGLGDPAEGSADSGTGATNLGTGVSPDIYHIIQSADEHSATAYSDNSEGLFNIMKTEISLPDGFLQKTRDTAMFSFGAEKLTLNDKSFLAIQDAFGRQLEGGFEKSITLKDCDIPFAMFREDLIKLSEEGIPELADSTMTLLLPTNGDDNYKANNIESTLVQAFGDSGKVSIKTFKWDGTNMNIATMIEELNLDEHFNSDQMNYLVSLFSDPKMWALLEAARDSQKPSSDEERDHTDWTDSFGGVSCRWGIHSNLN